jgi:hypothetical protein
VLDVETNECLDNNGGCWQDKAANLTACKVRIKIYCLIRCLLDTSEKTEKRDRLFCFISSVLFFFFAPFLVGVEVELSYLDSQFKLLCSWLKFIFQLTVVFMFSGYISWEGV